MGGLLTQLICGCTGRYSDHNGSVHCDACPVGHFASTSGFTACWQCPRGLTTLAAGTELASSCLCLSGPIDTRTGDCLQDIWLTGLAPFTGAWNAGSSIERGVEIILDGINANPSILPGYHLNVKWWNTGCSVEEGFLVFVESVSMPIPVAHAYQFSSRPIGLLGPGCSGVAVAILPTTGSPAGISFSPSAQRGLM